MTKTRAILSVIVALGIFCFFYESKEDNLHGLSADVFLWLVFVVSELQTINIWIKQQASCQYFVLDMFLYQA